MKDQALLTVFHSFIKKSIPAYYLAIMTFGDIYVYFIFLAFLVACTAYFQKKTSIILYIFPPFLMLAFLVEATAIWMSYNRIPNVLLYTVFTTIEFVFYAWLIRELVETPMAKSILSHILWIYPALVTLNKLFLQKGNLQFPSITYSLGCLTIVAASIFYFYELFESEKYIDLTRDPFFWICSGLVFYYCCSFPLFAVTNFLSTSSNILIKNYGSITSLLNILLYSSFIIASLCRIKIRKSFF